MRVKNVNIESLRGLLTSIAKEKTPFPLIMIQNIGIVDDIINKLKIKRDTILDKYCVRTEQGSYLGKRLSPKSKQRIENPTRLDDLDIKSEQRDECYQQMTLLLDSEVEVQLIPLDLTARYFDNQLNSIQTVNDYLNQNYSYSTLVDWIDIGLIPNPKIDNQSIVSLAKEIKKKTTKIKQK